MSNQAASPSSSDDHDVVIVGGGVAALEAALALRAGAGDEISIALIAPQERFVYRPLSVLAPFEPVEPLTLDLAQFCAEQQITVHQDRVASVAPAAHAITTEHGARIGYRKLLLATGAQPVPAVAGALSFRGYEDALALRGALDHIEWHEAQSLVFVVPERSSWVLPLYELALLSRARLDDRDVAGAEVTVVTSEGAPLEMLGEAASDTVALLLARTGVRLRTGTELREVRERELLLDDGTLLPADHVFCGPRLRGTMIEGLPHDRDGFLRVDAFCRVRRVKDVYAAGDVTDWIPKQGGLAAQQADVAAGDMLAALGYPVQGRPFEPVLAGVLINGEELRTLESQLEPGAALPWQPPSKIAARHLAPYLDTRAPESRDSSRWQREQRIPGEIELLESRS
jgi:sulfide:quinone oxidoreductase